MRKIYLISDTHFGHENIIQFCGRPFKDAALMDEALVTAWNETVSEQDIVYHLGDVYFGEPPKFLKTLKGKKRLILGNHDNPKCPVLQETFQKIMLWRTFREHKLILSHMPLLDRGLGGGVTYQENKSVHGHIHHKEAPTANHVNVCVEWTDYKPIELESLFE